MATINRKKNNRKTKNQLNLNTTQIRFDRKKKLDTSATY